MKSAKATRRSMERPSCDRYPTSRTRKSSNVTTRNGTSLGLMTVVFVAVAVAAIGQITTILISLPMAEGFIVPSHHAAYPKTFLGRRRRVSSSWTNTKGVTTTPTSRTTTTIASRCRQQQQPQYSLLSSQIFTSTNEEFDKAFSETMKTKKLDDVLAKLTSGFPFFVLGTAILALVRPSLLQWTNRGELITIMLSAVMWGTGLTLTKDDFTVVLKQNLSAVPAGVLCQFLIMPFSAYLIGTTVLSQAFVSSAAATKASIKATQEMGKAAFLGLCLVGCSPGGTASNLVSLIAKADVALSVLLTSCSTILASVATPLLVKLLVGSTIAVSGWTLCAATAKVVLLPVLLGMIVNANAPNLSKAISRFTPFCSVVLVALICGGVVAENASLLKASTRSVANSPKLLLPILVASVLGLHCLGFLVGYLIPKLGLGFSEKTSRTISIETGMQNSALAVVLARSIGAPAIASLPGALSATAHSCLGSILAAFWRGQDAASAFSDSSSSSNEGSAVTPSSGGGGDGETPDDYPELMI
mmetsp:Transcript_58779/g.143781  ORF Transcript_58779/g.143781 Transcript_58779/m.143781 type:complete len:530 (-) Transcript_58779:88-1677(-)|eukprot:CAMPEP_0113443898 /NCGR_PEP_ID=MMETSP0014_2-20120614/2386_1 /TAXON_ID=2857 /ORGANISM="Nitzschia sp." /LENGTH=529 /DNA_ID=CAMNT_0000334889 /DNA_START=62 /DNA_END=1651 /DNA_ORIENTATION=- /assembly_acc=CAM_ASM_000159